MAQITEINASAPLGAKLITIADMLRRVHGDLVNIEGPRAERANDIPGFRSTFGVMSDAGATAVRDRIPGVLTLLGNDDLSSYTKEQLLQFIANLRDFKSATLPKGT